MRDASILTILILLVGCNPTTPKAPRVQSADDTIQLYVPVSSTDFRMQSDFEVYTYKKRLANLLSLRPLELGVDSFELRFWSIGSMMNPVVLYVLKKPQNGNWTNIHYQIYRGESWNSEIPGIESLEVESVRPLTMSWNAYIAGLNIDSLWMTPSQREVVDEKFGGVDGYTYCIELADHRRYRFISYYIPDVLKDKEPNHRRVFDFRRKLSETIIYKGMINP